MFESIKQISDNIKRLSIDEIAKELWSQKPIQQYIISLNTQEQLYDLGIDSNASSLGDYADFTVKHKMEVGLPYDHVTLYESGEFYASFRVVPNENGFEIEADTVKHDKALDEVYGEAIIGLTEENKAKLAERIKQALIDEIRKRIIGY